MYRLDEGVDWSDLNRLPKLNRLALGPEPQDDDDIARVRRPPRIQEGGRWLALRCILCREGGACAALDEMLALAEARNDQFEPPLESTEWVNLAIDTFHAFENGRLKRCIDKGTAYVRTPFAMIEYVAAYGGKHSGDAALFWLKLVREHVRRIERGESFALDVLAMARAGTMPGWTLTGSLPRATRCCRSDFSDA